MQYIKLNTCLIQVIRVNNKFYVKIDTKHSSIDVYQVWIMYILFYFNIIKTDCIYSVFTETVLLKYSQKCL
jgi:hypothetical protein